MLRIPQLIIQRPQDAQGVVFTAEKSLPSQCCICYLLSMRDESEIEKVLDRLPTAGSTKYGGMTYEEGIEEGLRWVLEEITDEEFTYPPKEEP